MTRFIPYEKRSKKERRKADAIKRLGWNGVDPATKTIAGKKNVHVRKPKHPRSEWEE
ncbi:MAG: hypothetical protein K6F27_00025 [Ruminococcus sp.]|nr:hypothetical protein [Ruminococcus sp.]